MWVKSAAARSSASAYGREVPKPAVAAGINPGTPWVLATVPSATRPCKGVIRKRLFLPSHQFGATHHKSCAAVRPVNYVGTKSLRTTVVTGCTNDT